MKEAYLTATVCRRDVCPPDKPAANHRYETCTCCGRSWNISISKELPQGGYVCPHCRSRRRRRSAAKKLHTALALVTCFLILGTFGGLDRETIGLEQGLIQLIVLTALFGLFAAKAGAFEPCE